MKHKASIFTADQILPMSGHTWEAMLVLDGEIEAVGSIETLRELAPDAELHALKGVIVPGFIDAHLHPMPMLFFELSLDFREVENFEVALTEFAEDVPPGDWVTGIQFEPERFSDVTRERLDAILPDHRVVIYTRDGHGLLCNSLALEAGSVESAADPEGGRIIRDATGRATGLLLENAMRLVQKAQGLPDPAQINDACDRVFGRLAAQGITSFGAMFQSDAEGPGGAAAEHELMFYQALMGRIPQSAYGIVMGADLERIAKLQGGERLRFGGWKGFVDGTFGSSTAALFAPFEGEPENKGLLVQSAESLYERMEAAHLIGLQISLHAIGDRGVELACDLYERLLKTHPRKDHRHRIEHASLCPWFLIRRMAELELVAVIQPMFVASEMGWLPERIGTRVKDCYPFGAILRGGVAMAGSSDAPMETTSVLEAMAILTGRKDAPEQRITAEEALACYTSGAAFALKARDCGTLERGRRADFVVLDRCPLENPMGDVQVAQTYIRGEKVFSQ